MDPALARLAALAAVLAVAAGCETAGSSIRAEPSAPTSVPATPAARIAIGPDADTINATTIVGKPAPAWDVDWMGAPPLAVTDLRGRVVLVRWFTDGCPYCKATAPTLVAFDRELRAKGLAVIGIYHHKSDEPLRVDDVHALVARFGFQFPVAIDPEWRTLRRWWLDAHDGWTSVSFLIDRRGLVRYVHTGGAYAPDSADAAQMRRWIDGLLAEPPPAAAVSAAR